MEGAEVRIRRQGAAVILEPVASDWAWLDGIVGEFSDDFFATGRSQPGLPPRERNSTAFSTYALPARHHRLHRPAQRYVAAPAKPPAPPLRPPILGCPLRLPTSSTTAPTRAGMRIAISDCSIRCRSSRSCHSMPGMLVQQEQCAANSRQRSFRSALTIILIAGQARARNSGADHRQQPGIRTRRGPHLPRLDAFRRGPVTSSVTTEEFPQFNLHLAAPPATGDMPLAQLSTQEGLRLLVETIQQTKGNCEAFVTLVLNGIAVQCQSSRLRVE